MAQDKLKLAIGQRGNWDTAVSHIGEKAGIFKKHGIELDMTYTSGSGETLQPVISNSVDIGLAIGTMGAISAYAKGAPVRVIGAEATGAADYWYAKADSGIKTLKDTNGKTIAFSSRGSSTNSIVLAFINEFKLTAKLQGDRLAALDAYGRYDQSGRCRLGRPALRPEGDGRRQDQSRRQGDGCHDRCAARPSA